MFNPGQCQVLCRQSFAALKNILERVQVAIGISRGMLIMRSFFVARPTGDNVEMVLKMPHINQWNNKRDVLAAQHVILMLDSVGGVSASFSVQACNVYIPESHRALLPDIGSQVKADIGSAAYQ